MASRKEQKERLRAERVAKEEAERKATSRRRTIQIGAAVAAVAAVAVVVVVIASGSGGGGDGGDDGSNGSGLAFHENSVPAAAEAGVQDTPPPWQPETQGLTERVDAMGLPAVGAETFHQHASLRIYVDGKQVPIPVNIGADPATQTLAALHTHDTAGIIHMEADQEYEFTLGQFMAVWGVKFSDGQIGSLKPKGNDQLQVYLNGKRVDDPVNVVMPEKGNIVIGYGKSGSFPTEPKINWPQDL